MLLGLFVLVVLVLPVCSMLCFVVIILFCFFQFSSLVCFLFCFSVLFCCILFSICSSVLFVLYFTVCFAGPSRFYVQFFLWFCAFLSCFVLFCMFSVYISYLYVVMSCTRSWSYFEMRLAVWPRPCPRALTRNFLLLFIFLDERFLLARACTRKPVRGELTDASEHAVSLHSMLTNEGELLKRWFQSSFQQQRDTVAFRAR